MLRECRILANYFHGHVLRMNGYDTDQDILVSARELDCLKWTAAGKTALEASIILGISERTVRFHLNAAREKLDCVTTTQAVAKAHRKSIDRHLTAPRATTVRTAKAPQELWKSSAGTSKRSVAVVS